MFAATERGVRLHLARATLRGGDLQRLALTEVARARRHAYPVTVLAISLDPKLGPHSGRTRTRAVAKVLSSVVRISDLVGFVSRYRIAALLPNTPREGAIAVMTRFRDALDDELSASVRLGDASFPDEEVTWEGLKLRAAEREQPLHELSWSNAPLHEVLVTLAAGNGDSPIQADDGSTEVMSIEATPAE